MATFFNRESLPKLTKKQKNVVLENTQCIRSIAPSEED